MEKESKQKQTKWRKVVKNRAYIFLCVRSVSFSPLAVDASLLLSIWHRNRERQREAEGKYMRQEVSGGDESGTLLNSL